MTEELMVSVSGIRGIIGQSLNPEQALQFAAAYGSLGLGEKIIVGRDSRPSGIMINHAVIAGLLSVGCEVLDVGIVPTPTIGVAVQHLKASGAIQITASHNPAPWNGLKMFGDDGAVLSAEAGSRVKTLFQAVHKRVAWNQIPQVLRVDHVVDQHIDRVLQCVDVEAIRRSRFRVLIDGNGGAGGPAARQLLQALGCTITELGCEADGHFVHNPEPTPEHLVGVAPQVLNANAQIGFVLDPDSDRLALIDETGTCVSEELTLALALQQRLSEAPGSIVVNMSTSRVNEDIARKAGSTLLRSAVGEANVVALMRQEKAILGGEGNGGVIDPRIGWVRDPFIGMGLILNLMAATGATLSELVKQLPHYAMKKTKVQVDRACLPEIFTRLEQCWPEARLDRQDGLRIEGDSWWLHLRASNTEPIVRLIAESPDQETTDRLIRQAAAQFS